MTIKEKMKKDEKLILRTVWDAYQKYQATAPDWEDIKQEALYWYAQAEKTYDASKGVTFSTWAMCQVRHHLNTYMKKHHKSFLLLHQLAIPIQYIDNVEDWETPQETNALNYTHLTETLMVLSKEARNVCEIILKAPEEFLSHITDKRKLTQFLRGKGWKWETISAVFRELKETF